MMKRIVNSRRALFALAAILAVAVVSPALGGPSLRSLVKKEVKKQIAKATGPAGANGVNGTNGTNGTNGAPGTARAYASVDPSPTPSLDTARTSGFVDVSLGTGTGAYCLTPVAGINPTTHPAVAVGEFGVSSGARPYYVDVRNSAAACPAGDYQVTTLQGDPLTLTDDVAFNIIVP